VALDSRAPEAGEFLVSPTDHCRAFCHIEDATGMVTRAVELVHEVDAFKLAHRNRGQLLVIWTKLSYRCG